MAEKTFHYSWEWQLKSSPEQLWPYVSDTQRFNRATVGYSVRTLTEDETGVRKLRARRLGVPLEWDEHPFEWERPHRFGVLRRYQGSFVRDFSIECTLMPQDTGTLLRYEVTVTPATPLGLIAIPIQVGIISHRQFERTFKHIDEFLQAPQLLPNPYAVAKQFVSGLGAQRLQDAAQELIDDGYPADDVRRLTEYINTAEDDEAAHIRAYALADRWHAPRRAILELCLAATRRSLLDLSWELICPWCRGVKASVTQLNAVAGEMRCPSCNAEFKIDFDHSIEITFKPNAAIRSIEVMDYCVGGPQITPHILAQQRLAPNESRTLNMAFEPGTHRIRTRAARGRLLTDHLTFRVSDDPAEQPAQQSLVTANPQGWLADHIILKPQANITLVNHTALDQFFVIERAAWNDQVTSAADLSTVQAFRDWFATQALRPNVRLSIANLTILFTDLRGSTQLYRTIGDAPAFDRVLEHFEALRAGVNDQHGALVKTIGDAIMAVFLDPAQGVQAGLDILNRIAQLNATLTDFPYLLKMGLHTGPAIAVTLNDRLDYFGSTVNIAARLEGQALGDDLIVSADVMRDPGVQQVLTQAGAVADPFTAQLKGFVDEQFELYRIRLS